MNTGNRVVEDPLQIWRVTVEDIQVKDAPILQMLVYPHPVTGKAPIPFQPGQVKCGLIDSKEMNSIPLWYQLEVDNTSGGVHKEAVHDVVLLLKGVTLKWAPYNNQSIEYKYCKFVFSLTAEDTGDLHFHYYANLLKLDSTLKGILNNMQHSNYCPKNLKTSVYEPICLMSKDTKGHTYPPSFEATSSLTNGNIEALLKGVKHVQDLKGNTRCDIMVKLQRISKKNSQRSFNNGNQDKAHRSDERRLHDRGEVCRARFTLISLRVRE